MSVLPDFIPPSAAETPEPKQANNAFSNFSGFSSPSPADNETLANVPLAAKLRAYGKPWPLEIEGKVVCWLVPDEEAAKRCDANEAVYTAAEAEIMATLDAKGAQLFHKLKNKFGGPIGSDIDPSQM